MIGKQLRNKKGQFQKGNIPWSKGKMGKESSRWKGGKYIHSFGYVLIHCPNHPYCNIDGYVPEHRLVMEKHLRRYLKPKEVVHHINEKRTDNRLENLWLFESKNKHLIYHIKLKKRAREGRPTPF